MKNISKLIILSLTFLTFLIANCQTYYADIDGDGDGAKSVWCSYTDLPHATGGNWEDANFETNGCGTVGWNGDTTAGHLTYGPYISTDPGTTHVTWNMLANGDVDNDGTQIATIDIYDSTSEELLAWQNINVNDFNGSMAWQDFSLSYYSSPDHVYEFRTWYTGTGGHLVLRYITHINEDADAAGAYATTTLCDGDDTSGWSLNDDDLMPLCSGNSSDCWDECNIWGGDGSEDGFNCAGDCIEFWSCCELGDLEACCEAGDIDVCCELGDEAACCAAGDLDVCCYALGDLDACCNMGDLDACCNMGDHTACCELGNLDACCSLGDEAACCELGDEDVCCELGDLSACCNSGDQDACCELGDLDACCEIGALEIDCNGECGGDAEVDECDVCGGDGSSCACSPNGDANEDGNINVTDIVVTIEFILNDCNTSSEWEECNDLICSSDVNNDGEINVSDIVVIVANIIGR